tara:strand:- start:197 stop:472 length:276 start_codon:yes stop_codon:yes gene_type:complete
MNREVREKFGDKTHHAFDPIHNVRDFNQDPNVRHYEDKYHAMSPYLKDRFENVKGGKKKRRSKSTTRKPRKCRKGCKSTKRYRRKTRSRRR